MVDIVRAVDPSGSGQSEEDHRRHGKIDGKHQEAHPVDDHCRKFPIIDLLFSVGVPQQPPRYVAQLFQQ